MSGRSRRWQGGSRRPTRRLWRVQRALWSPGSRAWSWRRGEPIAPGYVEAQRKLRGDPEAALRRTADVVKAAVSGGQAWGPDGTMEIIIPRDYVTSGLKELLKQEYHLPFTDLTVGMPMANMELNPVLYRGLKAGDADRLNVSGASGERVKSWVVTIVK